MAGLRFLVELRTQGPMVLISGHIERLQNQEKHFIIIEACWLAMFIVIIQQRV